jgi:hypothetical protein
VVWAKGYTELVELMGRHAAAEGGQPHIDCYGDGEDLADVAATAKAKRLDLDMKGGIDHLDPSMHEYKVRAGPAVPAVPSSQARHARQSGKCRDVPEPAAPRLCEHAAC